MTNLQRPLSFVATCIATTFLAVMLLNFSNAQDRTEEKTEQGSDREDSGAYGGGGGFGFGGGFGGGGFGRGGSFPDDTTGHSPAIAAEDQYVYVVHNNILHQFMAKDLTSVNTVSLEPSAKVDD